jgi:hypothetical protein
MPTKMRENKASEGKVNALQKPLQLSEGVGRGDRRGPAAPRLAPMLYDDTDKEAAEALRASVVAKAERSPAAVTTVELFPMDVGTFRLKRR